MSEGLTTGAEVTAVSPEPTPAHWGPGDLEHWAQSAGSATGWRASFPGASVGLSFFQATQLFVHPSSKWYCLRVFFAAQLLHLREFSGSITLSGIINIHRRHRRKF